jgi:hypothetical protein
MTRSRPGQPRHEINPNSEHSDTLLKSHQHCTRVSTCRYRNFNAMQECAQIVQRYLAVLWPAHSLMRSPRTIAEAQWRSPPCDHHPPGTSAFYPGSGFLQDAQLQKELFLSSRGVSSFEFLSGERANLMVRCSQGSLDHTSDGHYFWRDLRYLYPGPKT